MKNPLLLALLGLTVSVVTPSIAMADNLKFGSNKSYQNGHNRGHNYNRKQANRHVRKQHSYNKHRNKSRRHNNKPKTSFSIILNSNIPNVIYNNGYNYNNASRYANTIYQRQNKQQRRIHKGKESGQLVRREVKQLRQEQRQIKHKLAHYKRDGRLNRRERARIHQMLNVASKNIRNKRHNRLTRSSNSRKNQYKYAWD